MSVVIQLVLASASPRRHRMLGLLGIPFECVPADVDERPLPGEPAALHVMRVARAKADSVASCRPEALVLAADTIVVVDGEVLGKPVDRGQARAMLERLSGRTHTVLTAMAVVLGARSALHLESSAVTFATLAAQLIDWYLTTGEGDDKAGAYAVQGRAGVFVARVEGSVQSVTGLPLAALPSLVARVGLTLAARDGVLTLSRQT